MASFDEEIRMDEEENLREVAYIRERLPQEVKPHFSDDDILYFIDAIVDYYYTSGILESQDDEIDIDMEQVAEAITAQAKKDGQGTFDRGYVGHQSARMMARSKAIEKRREAAAEEKSRLLKNVESAAELKLAPLLLPGKRILEVRDLRIDYGAGPVCGPLRFELLSGECLALLGGNGTGKSSVLKLICGEAIPHSGYVERLGGLRLSYVPQDSSFLRGALRDYAAECGIEESLFFAILRKLGFERVQFEKDLRELSAGQRKKVLIARSLCQQAHLYVWDEPMNYIDVISRMQIEQLLRRFRPTLLLVEHDRAFCEAVADRQIDLASGEKLV